TSADESYSKPSEYASCKSDSSVETPTSMPEPVENASKVVYEPKVWIDAPIIRNSQMSAKDKSRLGYGNQIHKGILSYENEVFGSVFDSRSSDIKDSPVNDRYAEEMHAVPPLMTRIYMPPRFDFGIDDSIFTYETLESVPKPVANERKAVSESKVWSNAPIIEEYELDSDDEHVTIPLKEQEKPSFDFVNTVKHDDPHKALKNKGIFDSGCSRNMTGTRPILLIIKTIMVALLLLEKGKQHKASWKAKVVSSISQPLQLLHMDLFGPTSKGKQHKASWKAKVVSSISQPLQLLHMDLFGPTSDETSGILKDFIRQIENQLNQKVKTIRCYNDTKFKNRDIIEFYGSKEIKREYSNARTPQQNGVAERKNKTLIEAAKTMLADSFLRNTFWAEAVSTACYVLNRVLVTKPQNKTPYELITGKIPIISYIRPFGCHVTILNTIDHLVKFDGKSDAWFLVRYSLNSKAFRPVKSENKANKTAGPKKANRSTGTQDNIDIGYSEKEAEPAQEYYEEQAFLEELKRLKRQEKEANDEVEALRKESTQVSTASHSRIFSAGKSFYLDLTIYADQDNSQIPALEDIYDHPSNGIFSNASYDDEGVMADFTNLETTMNVSHIPTSRIHSIHPTIQILRDPTSIVQTRSKVNKSSGAYAFKAIGTKWVYMNKKDERGVVVRNKAMLVNQGHRKEEEIDYDKVFAPVARIEAIKIFLAFAYFMGFIVYQMDMKSAFLYGKIDEEVYVTQPSGFVDPKYPKKVYRVVKALYGLHQAPRARYATLSTFLLKNGYKRGTIDKTLFIKKDKKDIMLVKVYVEDIIFGSTKKSWPDIMFAVCACSRFQVTPKTSHLHAVKRIFSDYAGANLDRKSTTGGCQFLGTKLVLPGKVGAARHKVSAARGEGSGAPIEPQHTPFLTHPCTVDQPPMTESSSSHDTTQDSRDSLEGTNRSEWDLVQSSHDSPLSGGHTFNRAEGALNLEELFFICTNLSNRVFALETIKDAQAAEIIALKARIKNQEKKYYMDTEEPVNEGRLSEETKELKLSTDTKEIAQDKRKGEKGGSTEKLVSTARLEDSTVRPDVGTADLIAPPTTTSIFDDEDITMDQTLIKMKEEKVKEKGVSIKDIKDSSRPASSILTLKPLPTIDPKNKGKGVLKEPEPAKKMTRSNLDAAQIAKDAEVERLVYKEKLTELEREKEKRHREEEASKAAIAEMYDEVQAGIEADALFAAKPQQEEREYTIEERAKFLAETIAAQRRFRAAQRSAEIRSRPPTKSQLKNLMMTYLKNMDLDDAVDKEKVLEEPNSTKVKVKQGGDEESIRKRPGRRLKMKATKKSKRKKTDSDLKQEARLKTF
nr:putative ribonuclease H-like domain-containing protein [Tanacetum cinerariifolium]